MKVLINSTLSILNIIYLRWRSPTSVLILPVAIAFASAPIYTAAGVLALLIPRGEVIASAG